MIKRKDYNGNEYYNATDAASFLGMPGSTFLYFYDKRCILDEQFKPKYHIFKGKKIWWITELNEWKNKTSHIQFTYKKKAKPKVNFTNKSNVTTFHVLFHRIDLVSNALSCVIFTKTSGPVQINLCVNM